MVMSLTSLMCYHHYFPILCAACQMFNNVSHIFMVWVCVLCARAMFVSASLLALSLMKGELKIFFFKFKFESVIFIDAMGNI